MPCVRAVLNLRIAGGYLVSAPVLAYAYHIPQEREIPFIWVLAQNRMRHHEHSRYGHIYTKFTRIRKGKTHVSAKS